MEISRFFDSTPEDRRIYSAADFAEYTRNRCTTGIYTQGGGAEDFLKVTADGDTFNLYVRPGKCNILGREYENDAILTLTPEGYPTGTQSRIDRVVLRLDLTPAERSIKAVILTGTPSENPEPPNLTVNEFVYEYLLATIQLPSNKAVIEQSQITDERMSQYGIGERRVKTGMPKDGDDAINKKAMEEAFDENIRNGLTIPITIDDSFYIDNSPGNYQYMSGSNMCSSYDKSTVFVFGGSNAAANGVTGAIRITRDSFATFSMSAAMQNPGCVGHSNGFAYVGGGMGSGTTNQYNVYKYTNAGVVSSVGTLPTNTKPYSHAGTLGKYVAFIANGAIALVDTINNEISSVAGVPTGTPLGCVETENGLVIFYSGSVYLLTAAGTLTNLGAITTYTTYSTSNTPVCLDSAGQAFYSDGRNAYLVKTNNTIQTLNAPNAVTGKSDLRGVAVVSVNGRVFCIGGSTSTSSSEGTGTDHVVEYFTDGTGRLTDISVPITATTHAAPLAKQGNSKPASVILLKNAYNASTAVQKLSFGKNLEVLPYMYYKFQEDSEEQSVAGRTMLPVSAPNSGYLALKPANL